ncbi:MAG: 50S ribosomal protein L11 methyltransferase [Chloroflexota bacterium]|nr:50S ribosomal protein L11 methyltransferase [Chloroflexota bacterium]
MFFPFHLTLPKEAGPLHQQVLDWCQAEKRTVYLDNEAGQGLAPTKLERRTLTEMDLALLEIHLTQAEQNLEFGGFVGGQELREINSLSFFKLDQSGEHARLVAFVSNDKLTLDASPLQSPLLLLPMAELLHQEQAIESFYLPFHEIWQEDFISLALYYFAPAPEPGWWQQANTQAELAELLDFPVLEPIKKWLELSMQVEPDILDYVRHLFSRCGYQQRLLIKQGHQTGEEEAPSVLYAYLPAGEAAEERITELSRSLDSLIALRPIGKLYVTERSPEYWLSLWNEPNLFRVGQHIVLTPDRKDFIPTSDEILVEIPASLEIFSLSTDGPHPSTALCLEMLEKHFDPTQHTRLLDLGTGSGVLSIVAIHLGAKKILALDAFGPAVDAARLNIAHNGVSDQIQVEAGSLAVLLKKDSAVYTFEEAAQRPPFGLAEWLPFDVIVSNTFAYVLTGLAEPFFEALRPGGLLVTSGILNQKAEEVAAAFEKAGLQLIDQMENDNWTSFAHCRPTEPKLRNLLQL